MRFSLKKIILFKSPIKKLKMITIFYNVLTVGVNIHILYVSLVLMLIY